MNFGAPGQDGTVIWDAINGSIASPFPAINVQAGTLKGVGLSFLLDGSPISVAAGATLDFTGNSTEFAHLTGGGSIIDSGVADDFDPRLGEFLRRNFRPAVACRRRHGDPERKEYLYRDHNDRVGRYFQLGGGATDRSAAAPSSTAARLRSTTTAP